MRPVFVEGLGFWAPGFPGAAAWAAGAADPAAREPAAAILSAALRRRASGLTRLVAEVAAQAAGQAGVGLAGLRLVLGSALGEIASAAEIIASFRGEGGLPSPTRFHNSVHNTAVGYLSIAAGNRLGASALAAGPLTPAMALLEAAAQLEEADGPVLLLLADEALPAPLRPWGAYQSAAAALCLSPLRTPRSLARLEGLRLGAAAAPALPPAWAGHPCGPGLALVAAVQGRRAGTHGLGASAGEAWCVDLSPETA